MNPQIFASLMDQAGAPAHPLIFLILGVVTFALHIAAVAVTLGALLLAVRGMMSADKNARRLAGTMAFTAKAGVGALVVLGVAPLLFVQVVYDPFWYTSNVLSAGWTIGFLFLLMLAYLMLYRFQSVNPQMHERHEPPVCGTAWLAAALVLLIVCGVIIHVLAVQALQPAQWMTWYAPNGVVDPSGLGLHEVGVARLVFFLTLAMPATAAWLYGMRRYLLSAGETDFEYIDWLEERAFRMGRAGGILMLVLGVVWMLTLPENMRWFTGTVWPWIGAAAVLFLCALPYIQRRRRLCVTCNYMAGAMTVVAVLVLGAVREILRYGTLAREAGWEALAYKVNFDVASTVIFFVTFLVVGGTCIAYMLALAWKAGQCKGEVATDGLIDKLGAASVALLAAWFVGYFAVALCTVALG